MKINPEWYKKSGIYCIINLLNQKKYIGSSINVGTRLAKHISILRGNYHFNSHLQNAYNKYGESNFSIYLLELDINNLTEKEQFYIDLIRPDYNITTQVIRNVPSVNSRNKHSATKKKLFEDGLLKVNCAKQVTKYSLDGELIATYSSIRKAALANNIHNDSVQRCILGKTKQAKGFTYRVAEDKTNLNWLNLKSKRGYFIKVTNLINNKYLIFYSAIQCSKFFNCTRASIDYVIGKSNSGTYKGRYKIDLIKLGELLEKPEEVNQQPSLESNFFEGSTTNSQILRDSNADTSAQQSFILIDDIV